MAYDNVTLIPYNYPFGIPKVFNTNFLQYALLNIALDQFCSENTYIFNFDIDEMLMVDPKHLNNILSSKDVYYKVRTWWVPMTLDKNNNLWVAHFHGTRISIFNKKAKRIHQISLPAKNITNCTFGGQNNSELFVTSATKSMNKQEIKKYKFSGALFSVKTNMKGFVQKKYILSNAKKRSIL